MEDHVERARKIISNNIYCTIATVSHDSKPWATPVYFAFDEKYTIYWYSQIHTRHSQNIADNHQVAVTIFHSHDADGNGVYIEAHASAVSEGELPYALVTYFERLHPEDSPRREEMARAVEDFKGESPLRMYKAVPQKVFVTNTSQQLNGKWLDQRVEVTL